MQAENLDERVQTRTGLFPQVQRLLVKMVWLVVLLGLLMDANPGSGAEASFTEYQVKAAFLYNFTKYVEWPAHAFAGASSPISIGVMGEGILGEELKKAVEAKIVNGRPILVRRIQTPEDSDNVHLLFIGTSEKSRLAEILGRIKTKPVLTVGETDQFLEQGGVINFVKKEGRIRLEINLDAARQAKLQISSKLLSVADTVKGKSK
jgi:hypothetical protein